MLIGEARWEAFRAKHFRAGRRIPIERKNVTETKNFIEANHIRALS